MSTNIRQLKDPVSEDVFYPQTDIAGLVSGGGSGIDTVPTAGSGKLVQSSGVFNAVAEAGVVNISEVNKVGTTLAVYSSLSDAIAAVPVAYKRGGMSIKFIQRTNTGTEEEPVYVDKYVQNRYMSNSTTNADFTNVNNWQGVDDEPTAGSENLIKSSGTVRQTIDLNSLKGTVGNDIILFTKKEADVGEVFKYSFTTNDGQSGLIRLFDSDGGILLSIGKSSITQPTNSYNGSFTIPTGFSYVKVITSGTIEIELLVSEKSFIFNKDTLDALDSDAKSGYINQSFYKDKAIFVIAENKIDKIPYSNYSCIFLDISSLSAGDIIRYYGAAVFGVLSYITTDVDGNIIRSESFSDVAIHQITVESNETYIYFNSRTNFGAEPYISIPRGQSVLKGSIDKLDASIDDTNTSIERVYTTIEDKTFSNLETAFTINDTGIDVGDAFEFSVESQSGGVAYIELLDSSNTRLAVYGVLSTKNYVQQSTGSFILPEGFSYARIGSGTNKTAKVCYLHNEKNITSILANQKKQGVQLSSLANDAQSYSGIYHGQVTMATTYYANIQIPNDILTNSKVKYQFDLKNLQLLSESADAFYLYLKEDTSSTSEKKLIGIVSASEVSEGTEKSFSFRYDDINKYKYIQVRGNTSDLRVSFDYTIISHSVAESKTVLDDFNDFAWKYRADLENRLASPIFESFEHYNQTHSEAPIVEEMPLDGSVAYRVPSVAVTNAGTVLVAGMYMLNAEGDYGDFSIHLARKASGGAWNVTTLIQNDRDSYGNTQNTQFVIDRTGAHGVAGRIYFFFTTTKLNAVVWEQTTESVTPWYIYSDDDGITWSEMVSLKHLQDTSKYDLLYAGVGKGVQMSDGTLVATGMAMRVAGVNRTSAGVLFIKKPNEDWTISSLAQIDGVDTVDEGAVVAYDAENVIFVGRNNTTYGEGINSVHHFFKYNIANDIFTYIEGTFYANRHDQLGLDSITINGTKIYLMTFTDQNDQSRKNITLWASLDCKVWIRVYRLRSIASAGYSSIDNYNGQIAVAYEGSSSSISYQDISVLNTLIYETATKFIRQNITVQDRLQMLYNYIKGID